MNLDLDLGFSSRSRRPPALLARSFVILGVIIFQASCLKKNTRKPPLTLNYLSAITGLAIQCPLSWELAALRMLILSEILTLPRMVHHQLLPGRHPLGMRLSTVYSYVEKAGYTARFPR